MAKDDLIYVGHMLDTATAAVGKLKGVTREAFDRDDNLRLALTHLIQTIGEAARRVSDEFQRRHSDLPWRSIIGMRHKVVLDYMEVDYDLVWDVVREELPPLIAALSRLVPPEDAGH